MSQTPKILLLSWSIPPGITGSGIIVSNLVKQFTRDEMVVLGAYWMGSPQFTWQRGWPKLYYSGLQPANGLRGERWLRWAQLPLILMRLVWISLVERCDVLFTIYPDMIYLFAGYAGSVLLGKPLIVYFHNTLKEAKPHSTFASWLQSHVFRRANHVFVMSDGMQNLYAENYPVLVSSPLRHSFNEPLPVFEQIEQSLNEIHKPLRLAFSGSINSSNFDAVRTVGQVMRELPNAALTIFTGTSRSTLESLGLSQPEIEITSVSRDAIIQKLTEADILLLPHGFTASIADAETRTIFPTKTIEYLLSGRPIVALLPQACFLADFLRSFDCAFLVTENNVDQLRQAIQAVSTDATLRKRLVKNAFLAVQQFYAPTIAEQLRDKVRQAV